MNDGVMDAAAGERRRRGNRVTSGCFRWRWQCRPLRWLASAVLLTPLLALSTTVPSLSRGPYLQLLTQTSVTVVWRTDGPADCSLDVWPAGTSATTRFDGAAGATECVVAVQGLRPGREYFYVPLADGDALAAPSVFHTDDPTVPYTFLVLGDSGSGDPEQYAISARMAAEPADLILHTGDMVYPYAVAEEWDPKYFVPYRALLRRLVLWPCIGNHDIGADDGESWREVFHTPANNRSANEHYYSFKYGNARFVVLDTYDDLDPGTPQYDFLLRAIGSSTAAWKFVVFHDTIYSSGVHGSDESIRADLVPVFEEFGVDVVFMGHDHHYERTWPLRDHVPVPAGQGIVYVTSGGGGATVRETGASGFTAHAESTHHYVRVSVDGGLLNLEMVRADGSIGDSLSLQKEMPTVHDVTPVADTYIDAAADAWDHGGAEGLKVDAHPPRIAYLKFDLHRLRADVRSARLTLLPMNNSDDGGTIYPVADSTWVEGAGEGTGSGPGLKWAEVDTDANGMVDALDDSPWVPDFSRPLAALGPVADGETVAADVTEAFLHRGPGVYTLAIVSAAMNGTSYSAREHETLGAQPQLVVELVDGVCGNGVVEPGEECDQPECCVSCMAVAPGTSCNDDGLFCTGVERCDEIGNCRGSGDPCAGRAECARICDEDGDACADPPLTPCAADGLFCTEDACDGAGACLHTPRADCPVVADEPSRRSATDCYAVIAGIAPRKGSLAECRDGDPACDRDGAVDGACTFTLQVCALQHDMAGCRAATEPIAVERLIVKPKDAGLAMPPLPATAPVCGDPSALVVRLKGAGKRPGKRALKLTAVADRSPRKDRDKVVLRCVPAGE
jgi:predicted phosphodiesterase